MKKRIIHTQFLYLVGFTGVLLQLYLFLYGCSSPAERTSPVDSSASSLYSAKCSSCHRLLPPQDHTIETWRHYVDKYGKTMTDEQKQQVLDFLRHNAADSPAAKTPNSL